MSYVRGQAAYAEEAVRQYLLAQLGALGWLNDPTATPPGVLPYGATAPITLIDFLPDADRAVAPNTLAMTSGDEDDDVPQEMGAAYGGVYETQRPFFIDIFGEGDGIALRLADDVKGVLTGKFTGTLRYQPVPDPVNGGVLAGHLLEFDSVTRAKPQNTDYKRHWQVVKVLVRHRFSASENGGVS